MDPEKIDHYEAGVKSTWLDDRLTANISLFRTDIQDHPATLVSGAIGVKNLSLYLSGTWNDAGIRRARSARCTRRPTCTATVTGDG